jgi:hypothetical protein
MVKEIMVKAINEKKLVTLKFDSSEKGIIERKCVPYDIGPSRKYKDQRERLHFYDLESPDGNHNLSILEEKIISLEITDESFDPGTYVKWQANWFVSRDWGPYS